MRRYVLVGAGLFFFGLGSVGVLLPVLPTTPFIILALWCFAGSSKRLHDWLYNHRLFGPALQRWRENRVIPPMAKLTALLTMSASFACLALFSATSWYVVAGSGLLMGYGAWFILSKPSKPPEVVSQAPGERPRSIDPSGCSGI